MKLLKALLALALVGSVSCSRSDKFLEKPYPFNKSRFSQKGLLDISTSVNYAVDVDILWVIDNSGSMDPYQQAVINNSSSFINQFTVNSGLHWKMGMISTDHSDKPYMGFIQPLDWLSLNAVETFNAAVGRLGTNGDGVREATFQPTLNVLNANPTWLRPNAYFVVISVTDELEQSGISTQYFFDEIKKKLKGDLTRFFAYGVFGPDSNDSRNRKNEELVQRTGGKIYGIDSPDYGINLAAMAQDLVQKTTSIHPVIVLEQAPIISTIEVVYKGKKLEGGKDWGYNSEYNYIRFADPKIFDPNVLTVDISFEIDENYKP